MNLIDKLFPKKIPAAAQEAMTTFQTLTSYQPVFRSWSGCVYESELVRASIDAIARNVGKLVVEFNGAAKPMMRTKLSKTPNEWQTWYQFLYRTATILEVDNTAFIIPILDRYGEVQGLFPVLPTQTKIMDYKGTQYLQYTFRNGNIRAMEMESCGVLTKFQYRKDFFGESNQSLNGTMDLIKIQNQGIKEGVKNAATYRFMAKLNNFSSDEDLKNEADRFSDLNFGSKKKGAVLLFPNTYADIKQIDSKPFVVDAEQMRIIQTNVFNYFGVNEEVLQNKTYGDKWSAFYEGKIEPFSIQLSEVLTKMLYTSNEIARGSAVMATSNRLQYLSNTEKLNVSSQMLDRGIMSRNEIREIWNLPRIEDGDNYIIRGEYYEASEKLGEANEEDSNL